MEIPYLSTIKNYATIIVAAVGVTAIGILGFLYYQADQKYTTAESSRQLLLSQNKHLTEQIDLKNKSAKADQQVIAELNDKLSATSDKFDEVGKTIDGRIAAINSKYSKLDQTDNNRIAKQQEISSERIRGLWATYCIAKPQHEKCVKK